MKALRITQEGPCNVRRDIECVHDLRDENKADDVTGVGRGQGARSTEKSPRREKERAWYEKGAS